MVYTFALNEIEEVAEKVLQENPKKVILFHGQMGAGKTTFIKALAKKLGVINPTSSPTFSLVNEYETPNGLVYHFDMYRLKNESEAFDFGIEDYFYSGHWCFVEWAENIPNLIPESRSVIRIEIAEDGKRILHLS
ncbi:tRNA (adenosine(37)-N6)-threonylcarbamoyltransferase complex ATPase subunit type 1 TsaE [Flavobacterium sp.]|mgnify:CR=1 FL=1|uniref:tRNA (adenosine(37)-N6)-threonylcarbamoyltransferase complex ATPase subunit type 1 TsaE n=1 Tax=Flavobacterium sp. TaxID=239 RepID=UPI002FDB945C